LDFEVFPEGALTAPPLIFVDGDVLTAANSAATASIVA
jgi:hypothetical protein